MTRVSRALSGMRVGSEVWAVLRRAERARGALS